MDILVTAKITQLNLFTHLQCAYFILHKHIENETKREDQKITKKQVMENGRYSFWSQISPDRLVGCVTADKVLDFSLPQPFLL